jgi:DNA mismatch repair protein MutL
MNKPNRINILPDAVKKKIAAGEVIEGPFSVVKELMENSIDSGATEISERGLKRILIRDDGCGIRRDDLGLVLKEHATSKIGSIIDIEKISTLGFRGEALSSVSSISNMTILTRSDGEEIGGRIYAADGKADITEYAGALGTTIIVENLFYSVPARKKFMRSKGAEIRSIRETFLRIALPRPEISFSLTVDGKREITLGIADGIGGRQIYGNEVSDGLYQESFSESGIAIDGFLSKPDFFKSTRSMQMVYVNRRSVEYRYLGFLLSRAYEAVARQGQHPAAIILIEIRPDMIDVNIHPAKREIKFTDQKSIDGMIIKLARKALGEREHEMPDNIFTGITDGSIGRDASLSGTLPGSGYSRPDGKLFNHQEIGGAPEGRVHDPVNDGASGLIRDSSKLYNLMSGENLRVLGVIFSTYILIEHGDAVKIIDFHAAHERFIYDSIIDSRRGAETQELVFPHVQELPAADFRSAVENIDIFLKIGFDIEEFSDNSIIIRGVPSAAGKMDIGKFFLDTVETLGDVPGSRKDPGVIIAEKIACHSAKRSGDEITDDDALMIARETIEGKHELRCPHGRPFIYRLGRNDIERMFRRS